MYTDMEEQINLVSPEAIPAFIPVPGWYKSTQYQYPTGMWKGTCTSPTLVPTGPQVSYVMGGVSVVLKSITIINNKPGVSNVIPQEQRKKTNKKWNQKVSAKHLEELPKCIWKAPYIHKYLSNKRRGILCPLITIKFLPLLKSRCKIPPTPIAWWSMYV